MMKRAGLLLGIAAAGLLIWFGAAFFTHRLETQEIEAVSATHAGDPLALYKSVGIESCSGEGRYGESGTVNAAMLDEKDMAQIGEFLRSHFGEGVTAAIYTDYLDDPAAIPEDAILLPLTKRNDTYCVIGISDMKSVPGGEELRKKYHVRPN